MKKTTLGFILICIMIVFCAVSVVVVAAIVNKVETEVKR